MYVSYDVPIVQVLFWKLLTKVSSNFESLLGQFGRGQSRSDPHSCAEIIRLGVREMSEVVAWISAGSGLLATVVAGASFFEERRRRIRAETREHLAESRESEANTRVRDTDSYRSDLEKIVEALEQRFLELQARLTASAQPRGELFEQPPAAQPPTPVTWTLDTILDLLEQHHQRATYGAVAGLLGTGPNILLAGRPRNPRHSWIVNRQTGEPTGYTEQDIDPHLREQKQILNSSATLAEWLNARDV